MEAERLQVLKTKIIDSIGKWADSKIDVVSQGNAKLKVASVYMKRGVHNLLSREGDRMSSAIDKASLFICDEKGNIDSKMLMNDAITAFNEMEENTFNVGGIKIIAGKGMIKIPVPDNFLAEIIFGNTGAFNVTSADIKELFGMFINEPIK